MKNLSLKLADDIFLETEKIVSKVKKNRDRYINETIAFYNKLHRRKLLSTGNWIIINFYLMN